MVICKKPSPGERGLVAGRSRKIIRLCRGFSNFSKPSDRFARLREYVVPEKAVFAEYRAPAARADLRGMRDAHCRAQGMVQHPAHAARARGPDAASRRRR